jgi:hypothetical protein
LRLDCCEVLFGWSWCCLPEVVPCAQDDGIDHQRRADQWHRTGGIEPGIADYEIGSVLSDDLAAPAGTIWPFSMVNASPRQVMRLEAKLASQTAK